jgi:tellurite resistance protein
MEPQIGRDTMLALCAVAWADGHVNPSEAAAIRAAAGQLGIAGEDAKVIDQALSQRMGIEDVETIRMNRVTRLFTYSVAVWIAHIDGKLSAEEHSVLALLGDRLGLSALARERAKNVALGMAQSPDRPGGYDLVKLRAKLSAGLSQIGDE